MANAPRDQSAHYDAFLKIETIDSGVKTLRSR